MASGELTVTYEGNTLVFDEFNTSDLPGQWMTQTGLTFSTYGVGSLSGPVRRQRKMWSISAWIQRDHATKTDVADVNALFEAWDADRRVGRQNATCTLNDQLLFDDATTYEVVFTANPQYSSKGRRNRYVIVTMVLTEV